MSSTNQTYGQLAHGNWHMALVTPKPCPKNATRITTNVTHHKQSKRESINLQVFLCSVSVSIISCAGSISCTWTPFISFLRVHCWIDRPAKIMVGSKWFKTNTSRPNIDLDLIKTMPGTHLIDIIRGKQETFTRSMKSLQPAPVVENQEFQFQWYWMVLVLIRLTKTLTYVPRTTKL